MCDAPYRGDQWPCSLTPAAIPGASFSAIDPGIWATCGLDASGAASCTGWHTLWELGNGSNEHATAMTPVGGGRSFDALSLGSLVGCGLVGTAAYCWGGAAFCYGNTGNGSLCGTSTPAPVAGGLNFASVYTSDANNIYAHTCGLTTSGEAYCWGRNVNGELGTDVSGLQRLRPVGRWVVRPAIHTGEGAPCP